MTIIITTFNRFELLRVTVDLGPLTAPVHALAATNGHKPHRLVTWVTDAYLRTH